MLNTKESDNAPLLTFTANGTNMDLSNSSSFRFTTGMGLVSIKGDYEGKTTDESINLAFPDTLQPNTYSLSQMSGFITMNYQIDKNGGSSKTYIAQTGTLTVTKIDKQSKKVSGTFSFIAIDFNAMDTMVVTNGKFNLEK